MADSTTKIPSSSENHSSVWSVIERTLDRLPETWQVVLFTLLVLAFAMGPAYIKAASEAWSNWRKTNAEIEREQRSLQDKMHKRLARRRRRQKAETMTTTFAVLAGIIAVALARFAYLHLRESARSNRRRLHHAELFFKGANTLVSDDETPEEMLRLLDSLNSTISDKDGPRILMTYLLRGRQIMDNDESAKFRKIVAEFLDRRPELLDSWEQGVANWFLAISYLSWWRGPFLRSAIHNQELLGAAKRVERKSRNHDGGHFNHFHSDPARAAA